MDALTPNLSNSCNLGIHLRLQHKDQRSLLVQFVLQEIQNSTVQRLLNLIFILQMVFHLLHRDKMFLLCMLTLLNLAEKNYENLVEGVTNNVIAETIAS